MKKIRKVNPLLISALFLLIGTMVSAQKNKQEQSNAGNAMPAQFLSPPLIQSIFTADPSVHVFNGKIYIYGSHDIDTDKSGANGDHYDMKDYHVLLLPDINGKAKDAGIAIALEDIPWAKRQLWAPDAAYKSGKYYLFFPAKDTAGIFRIGLAVSKSPTGPFIAKAQPIQNSFSIDPCVFKDNDGSYYMYFGGLSGGQLQQWTTGKFESKSEFKEDKQAPALNPKIAKLSGDFSSFAEMPKDIVLLDPEGKPLLSGDHGRRFFEAAWVFKRSGVYYFTYSTGDTHQICYATGSNPYGPFTYRGVILKPVQGWTTHQSIIKYKGKWYLFYHDTEISGKNWLRNIKVTSLHFAKDGSIEIISPIIAKS